MKDDKLIFVKATSRLSKNLKVYNLYNNQLPMRKQIQSQKLAKVQQKTLKKRIRWTNQENNLYALFIQKNGARLILSKQQKHGIFGQMQKIVKTRTSESCKSHHQKMLKRYETIPKIVQNFLKKIPKMNRVANDERVMKEEHFHQNSSTLVLDLGEDQAYSNSQFEKNLVDLMSLEEIEQIFNRSLNIQLKTYQF